MCVCLWVYVMCVSVYLYVVCEHFCMCIATFIQWCVCASVQCLCTFRVPDGDTMHSILGDTIHVQKAWYTNQWSVQACTSTVELTCACDNVCE